MTLFNAMVNHSYTTESFLMPTMIPIGKNNQLVNISCVNNYRAIALSNLFWKILDRIF